MRIPTSPQILVNFGAQTVQVARLSQRNRSAGWVSFGSVVGDGMGQTILCTKRCPCQKTKSIDLLHAKSTFIRQTVTLRFEPLFGGLGATYNVHLRLIGIGQARSRLPISHNLTFFRYVLSFCHNSRV